MHERGVRPFRLLSVVTVLVLASACESTSIAGLNVRAAPTTASAVLDTLGDAGTQVRVDCFTRGESVRGDTIWYRITQPSTGYVSNYYIRTDAHILDTTRSC